MFLLLARLPISEHRLAEFIPWNQFLVSINDYKYGLWFRLKHVKKKKYYVRSATDSMDDIWKSFVESGIICTYFVVYS